jgi:hypothetical protein
LYDPVEWSAADAVEGLSSHPSSKTVITVITIVTSDRVAAKVFVHLPAAPPTRRDRP